MKNQIDILEDLFKLDSHSLGVVADFRSVNNCLVTRLSVGRHHSQFNVSWLEEDYKRVFDFKYESALEDLRQLLRESEDLGAL